MMLTGTEHPWYCVMRAAMHRLRFTLASSQSLSDDAAFERDKITRSRRCRTAHVNFQPTMRVTYRLCFLLLCLVGAVRAHCPALQQCECESNPSRVVCDGISGNATENADLPALSSLPSVEMYIFRNFKQMQAHAFENVTFLSNRSIVIQLINVSTIHSNAFSTSLAMPNDSSLSIDIDHGSLTLRWSAFNRLKIQRLRFLNVNLFNGRPVFDTLALGEGLQIDELIFEQTGLTGFTSGIRNAVQVRRLSIRQCPALTQLTDKSLPSFLSTSTSLEIADTGLRLINAHTFQAWALLLRELLIRNNTNFTSLPSGIVDGVLMELETLDLSSNPIGQLDRNYDWFPYSYAKHLVLKQQQLDLYLRAGILKTLVNLRTIDFSDGFVADDELGETNLIRDHVPNMPNLELIDVSFTNLTATMIVDLLAKLSHSANRTVHVRLLGQTLNDSHFCSFFSIFQHAPNLLRLELDVTHECNCVVDVFFNDEQFQGTTNHPQGRPSCLSDPTRLRCDIRSQLTLSKCSISRPTPDESGSNTGNLSKMAFIGMMVGLAVAVLSLLLLGSGMAYRVRRTSRRLTEVDMEQPAENPLAAVIEERLQSQH